MNETSFDRSPSTNIMYVSYGVLVENLQQMERIIDNFTDQGKRFEPILWGVPRSGTVLAAMLCARREWDQAVLTTLPPSLGPKRPRQCLWAGKLCWCVIDDTADTGKTIQEIQNSPQFQSWPNRLVVVMYHKAWCKAQNIQAAVYLDTTAPWLVYPWETGTERDPFYTDLPRPLPDYGE